jgi:hypothetical protein
MKEEKLELDFMDRTLHPALRPTLERKMENPRASTGCTWVIGAASTIWDRIVV